ncbi:MAG: hypothetical protein VKJ06_04445 [Vampirovibrionales bacterium]|nr:hypothetical protein [Vampirovibrionales bacterium]
MLQTALAHEPDTLPLRQLYSQHGASFSMQNTPAASPGSAVSSLKIGTQSQQLPAGAQLPVKLNTALDSQQSAVGDMFSASLLQDIKSPEGTLVLPRGTTLRGQLSQLRRRSLLARGGALGLAIDHIVLPSGDLMPLTLSLAPSTKHLTPSGTLVADPGIGGRIGRGFDQTGRWMGKLWQNGVAQGEQIGGGAGVILTAPAAAIGVGVGGAGLAMYKTGGAIFGFGDAITLKPGDTLTLVLPESADIPVAQ